MRLHIEATVDYLLAQPGPALLQLEAAILPGQRVESARIDMGELRSLARVPGEEGIGERLVLHVGQNLSCRYVAEIDVTRPQPDLHALSAVPVETMPGDALRYLLSSRYCVGERFGAFVHASFGQLQGGPRVAAMCDWVRQNVSYVPGSSDTHTTAADTFLDRQGVCRDYAHLLIALCRASMIPARIASVYAPFVTPQDFHAVTEVYLDGAWHLVDATGMASADQMAVIAVGRDATDVAFMTTVSFAQLQQQSVSVRPIA